MAPPVRSLASVIVADLLQDGAIAGGVLIALLVPITWYGSVTRRRERDAAARGYEFADSRDGQAADPLLEYFGPQAARPVQAAPRSPEPRFQPRPALAGRSTLSPAFAARPMLSAPTGPPRVAAPRAASAHADGLAAGAAPDAWTSADSGYEADSGYGIVPAEIPARPEPASAGRGGPGRGQPGSTLRHAPVSGAPPWGPAPRPTSELPWAVVPGPQGGGRPAHRGPGGPGGSGGQGAPGPGRPAVAPARPGHSRSSAPPRSIFDPKSQLPGGLDGDGWQRTDTGSRPIYTWNPEGESA
ncbi:MAG TPA: hypothetical protein VF843_00985 [Streptosporangiaceae bacterium]